MSAVILQFAPRPRPAQHYVNDDMVHACSELLRLAQSGELCGFAIAGMSPGKKLWIDHFGILPEDAGHLRLPLARLIIRLDELSGGEGAKP